jgi:hypothetical protein
MAGALPAQDLDGYTLFTPLGWYSYKENQAIINLSPKAGDILFLWITV